MSKPKPQRDRADQAREWLAAVEERKVKQRLVVPPPVSLDRLNAKDISKAELTKYLTDWLRNTACGGAPPDLWRAWSAVKGPAGGIQGIVKQSIHSMFQKLLDECTRAYYAASAIVDNANSIAGGERAEARELEQARQAVVDAEAALVQRREELGRLEALH